MKLPTTVCGVIALLAIVCMTVGQDKDESKKELEKLQGVWRVVSSQVGDEKASEDEVKRRKVTIKGDVLIYEYGNEQNEKREGTIKLDPKTKAFDWTVLSPEAGPTMLAIYELKEDELKIGFGNDSLVQVRPTRFVMGKDDVVWLLVLKRAAPDPVSDEMRKLEGTWIAVAYESGRAKTEGEEFKKTDLGHTLIIKDGTFQTINKDGKGPRCTMTINPAKTPKPLDRTSMVEGKKAVARSIYELDGDTLRLCTPFEFEHVRPRAFTQDGTYVMVYKRQAALNGEPAEAKKEAAGPPAQLAGRAAGVPALKLHCPSGPAVTMQAHTQPFGGLAFSPDGRRLAGGASDGAVWIWDASTGKRLLALPGYASSAGAVCFSPDGTLLASAARTPGPADRPGEVRLSDSRTGKTVRTCETGDAGPLAFSPDGNVLAGAGGHKPARLTLWDVATGKIIRTLGDKTEGGPLAFNPDGTKLAGTDDLRVTVWDVKTGKVVLRPGGDLPTCVGFSPDGKRLAAGGFWGEVWIWDTTTGKEVWRADAREKVLIGSHKRVAYVAFTPDGRYLVTAGHRRHRPGLFEPWAPEHDGEVKVWDAQAGKEQFAFMTHVSGVGGACLSADGMRVAASTLAAGQPVRLWSLIAKPGAGTVPGGL
jgi:uncharacterized protein (TIGR03067 family)